MSALATGNYYIVNNVATSSGIQLAANFTGVNTTINVVNFQHSEAQTWRISSYPAAANVYFISPVASPFLLIGMGGGGIEALDGDYAYVWSITSNEDVYTITDNSKTNFWDLGNATDGEKVILTSGVSGVTHSWKVIPALG